MTGGTAAEIRERHLGFICREQGYEDVLPVGFVPETIIDIGALYDSTSWLRDRFPGARIVATNVMNGHLDSIPNEWAEKRLGRAEELLDLPTADLLFLGEVLEHIVYPQEFLARAVDVLRPGGLILLSTPNLTTWHNRLLMLAGFSPSNYSMIPGRHLGLPSPIARIAGTGYGDHIRVFSYRALNELFGVSPWALEGITARSDVEVNRPYASARRMLSRMLPVSARETSFVCARLVSKTVESVHSTGFIGDSSLSI
jgi:SAM-dependent methyltransferase